MHDAQPRALKLFPRAQDLVAVARAERRTNMIEIAEARRETVHGQAVRANIAQRGQAIRLHRLLGRKLFEDDEWRSLRSGHPYEQAVQLTQHSVRIGAWC